MKILSNPLSWFQKPPVIVKRERPVAIANGRVPKPGQATPAAFQPATPKFEAPFPNPGNPIPIANKIQMPPPLAPAEQTLPSQNGGGDVSVAGARVPPASLLSTPPSEGASPNTPEGGKKGAPPGDDLMALFTEEKAINEDLRRLAESLKEVNIDDLVRECRQVAARVKRSR